MSAVFGPASSLLELCLYGHERNFGCVTTVDVRLFDGEVSLGPLTVCVTRVKPAGFNFTCVTSQIRNINAMVDRDSEKSF